MAKRLSVQQLKDFYDLTSHGHSPSEAARRIGRPPSTGNFTHKLLRRYIGIVLDGNSKGAINLRKTYIMAAKWAIEQDSIVTKKIEKDLGFVPGPDKVIRVATISDPEPRESTRAPQDHFTKLELAFSLFTDSVQACIKAEVKRQVGEVMAENEEMKAKLDEARLGNWTQALRKNFEG